MRNMGDFDWKIWLKKWGFGLGATVASTGLIYTSTFFVNNPLPPEYAFWGGLVVVFLSQIGNFIKHKYLNE